MANKYYCLIAGLPDILLGDKKTLYTSITLLEELKSELSPKDFLLAQALYYPYDHKNFLNLLYREGKEFDPRGVFTTLELEHLTDKRNIDSIEDVIYPSYLLSAVKEMMYAEEPMSKTQAEVFLTQKYYEYLKSFNNTFLNEYISYDVNQRNIFTALNGRKYQVDYQQELIGNDEVVEALTKSRSRDFGLSGELEYMESMVQLFEESSILDRELKIDQLKWNFMEEAIFFNYFTIERILAFIYKLFMVERWISLSEEEGKKLFQQLLSELESSYEFPEEFKLSHGKKK